MNQSIEIVQKIQKAQMIQKVQKVQKAQNLGGQSRRNNNQKKVVETQCHLKQVSAQPWTAATCSPFDYKLISEKTKGISPIKYKGYDDMCRTSR